MPMHVTLIGITFLSLLIAPFAAAEISSPVRYDAQTYSLVFQPDGRVELYAKTRAGTQLTGTVGAFRFPAMQVESGALLSLNATAKQYEESDKVHFANVATAIERRNSAWPEVTACYAANKGKVNATWTLLPDMVRVQYVVEPPANEKLIEEEATVAFTPAEGAKTVESLKPTKYFHHPAGGVPYQRTIGIAQREGGKGKSIIIANDKSILPLRDEKGIHLWVRDIRRPWQKNQLQASLVFGFGDSSGLMGKAIAVANGEGIYLNVRSSQPFYVWEDEDQPIRMTAWVWNLFPKTQRVDLEYIARDFDGKIVAQKSVHRRLKSMQQAKILIQIPAGISGPIFVDVTASHSHATYFQNLCVGVLPKREFLDGHASRFGISAYRGHVGPHTEARTQKQLLEFMHRLGIRWLRMTGDHALARQMGFFPWYHNGIGGDAKANEYFEGKPTWIDDPKNRENWLKGNLERILQQGNEYFEFSNEWNLYKGENKGVLAEKYVKDWMTILKPLRDKIAPKVKLAGCSVANADMVFMDKVYRAGGWDTFEALAFHAAGNPRSPDFDDGVTYWSYLATLRNIRAALKKYGQKELWMTEMYTPCSPNTSCSNNERTTAEDTMLSIALAVAADVRGFMYYCFDDFMRFGEIKTPDEIGEPMEREQYFGLVRFDWTPKVALWAYQTAAYYFDGVQFLGDVKLPDKNLYGLLFKGRNGKFAVLWSRKEGYLMHEGKLRSNTHRPAWQEHWSEQTPLDVETRPKGLTVVDCVGRKRTILPNPGGKATIMLTGAPVYVFGGDFTPVKGRFSKMLQPE